MILYNKNYNNKIQQWSIEKGENHCVIQFGELNGATQTRVVPIKEYQSRINKKLHEGYKDFTQYGVNQYTTSDVLQAVVTNIIWNTNDLSILPMKCQSYKENKLKYPVLGQPKLNGIRCVMRVEEVIDGMGMFTNKLKKIVLRSKEGLEYVMPHITESITIEQLGDNILDGELYCHGKKLNYIRSCVPMVNKFGTTSKPSGNPYEISFNCFDLAMADIEQKHRLNLAKAIITNKTFRPIIFVDYKFINSDKEAFEYRNECIANGYEGCVLRSIHEEYAFGSRPSFIMKFKKWVDREFEVIDIIEASIDDNVNGCKFICRNDINNETFESMPSGWNKQEQEQLILDKESIIGKKVTIKYYERSGVKDVPFHSNCISIRDYE